MPVTIEDVMEIACAICHYPYKAGDQDKLDEICAGCPMEDALRRFKAGESFEVDAHG